MAKVEIKGLANIFRAKDKLLKRRWFFYLMVLGPGIIAANAGNDGGGIATYASAGAAYGYKLCWMVALITILLFTVQEMCARMGAVTGKGLTDLIRENFGIRWTAFALVCILIANGGTIISEFVGIAAALELFHISKFISVPISAFVLWWLVVKGSYQKVERIFLLLTIPFFAYIVTAFKAHPDWHQVFHDTLIPSFRKDTAYLMVFVATVGTTITPYMQIILQSTVVEKGVNIRNYRPQWWDVLIGTVFGNVISLFIIIATAATLYKGPGVVTIDSAAQAAQALAPAVGHYAEVLFAIGLFGASMLAGAVLPLSTAFSISEALGWKKGVGYDTREAPHFYKLFTGLIIMGATVAIIPHLPLVKVLILTQTINALLLPVLLVFITKLSDSKRIMGEYQNKGITKSVAWITTISVAMLASWLVIATMILPLFGIKL